jgi:addiction module HigA family antidote
MYLEPFELSTRVLAEKLAVSPSTLNRVITGKSGISPEMALRLSKALGRSAESWLAMQDAFDLWQTKLNLTLDEVQRVDFAA